MIHRHHASLARTTHRYLQIVEEYHRVPNLLPHRQISLLSHQRTLKLQESPHPVLPFLILIEIIIKHLLCKAHTLAMQTAVATIRTTLITIMTLAQYHDSLAKDASVGIILAYEGLKENVATHILEQ